MDATIGDLTETTLQTTIAGEFGLRKRNLDEDTVSPQGPPQPTLPVRMPRRSHRGFDSMSSASYSSGYGNSSSSRSLPGTPASLSSQSLAPPHTSRSLTEVDEGELLNERDTSVDA